MPVTGRQINDLGDQLKAGPLIKEDRHLFEEFRASFLPAYQKVINKIRERMLSLFYLSLLGKTTVEAAKHLRRWEFGPLIGSGRAPAVKTLRRKLAALVGQSQALHFGQLLTKRWIDQALVATAYANDAELVSR